MNVPTRFAALLFLGSLIVSPCRGFGTGPHYDLTRNVLAERNFRDGPIKIAQVENWLTDYYSTSPTRGDEHREVLEKLHFDNLYTPEQVNAYWSVFLRNLRGSTEKAARDNDLISMFVVLGIGIHAVQDFYSHSNWAELHPPRAKGEFRSETFLAEMSSPGAALPKDLRTGKYPDDRTSGPGVEPIPAAAAVHGSYENGLNKDYPTRPRWDEAYVFAYAATHEILDLMEMWAETIRPGFWKSLREYTVASAEVERLDRDLTAARNVSMWLDAKGQDGIWKGYGSGSARFFTAFSSDWMASHSSVFKRAIHDGNIQDELASGLYERSAVPGLPTVSAFSLPREAVVIKITYAAESKKGRSLKSRLFTTSGSDFYSRIVAGGQEFRGRTMQHSRESIDPWYEIFLVDRAKDSIPITISVWDEDDIDSAKDEHIDINPASGLLDLRTNFRLSDMTLSGDVNGVFSSERDTFSSEGSRSDTRGALIRGFVTRYTIR